jgi:cytochrome c biogenesis protein CcmG/thiol:disulfide interchange protein DsbE
VTDIEVAEVDVNPAGGGRRTWVAVGGIVVAAALLAWVFSSRFGQDPRLVDSPLVGGPLPELTLEYMEQEGSLTFSDLEGQVVVINVWASWCVPCRIEHPALVAASETYAERGVRFVGLLYQDRVGPASEFLDEMGRGEGYSYIVDTDSRATVELGVFGVPETYFVDADGIVRGKVQGEVNPMVLVQTIEDLLAGREPEL